MVNLWTKRHIIISSHFSATSLPILLSCCGILVFCIAVVLMFCNFGADNTDEEPSRKNCCGQNCFLSFGVFAILPLVVWTATVVFTLGYPSDDLQIRHCHADLECDPKFWKAAFWIVIALILYIVIIIVFLVVRACEKCCARSPDRPMLSRLKSE